MGKVHDSFSKYDVLVDPPLPGVSVDYSLAKHNEHVGNLRFRVFLTMRQQSYMGARQRNDHDECNRIVADLIDTVCNQVIPRGRFLVSKSVIVDQGEQTLQWEKLDDTVVKSLLHKVLGTSETTPASLSGTLSTEGSNLVSPDAVTSRHLAPDMDVPSVSPPPLVASNADEGQKRRRRSSLLRRSNSESMVEMVLDNRKKLNLNACDPRGGIQEEPASWKSASPAGQLNRMDVVLTPSCDALDPLCITVGNNRLHILAAVRSGHFKTGSIEEQEKILDEMVETVYTFWKGRFLVERQGRGYSELSKGAAREAMRIILSGGSPPYPDTNTESRSLWQADLADEIKSFETLNVASSSQPAKKGLKGQELPNITSPLQNHFAAGLPSALIEDAHKNQNRALMDLKKQKTRNQNASRLMEKLGVAKKKTASAPSSEGGEELPLFPIGGMVHPSMLSSNSPGAGNKWFSPQTERESSSVFKVDASVMEKLVAELDVPDGFDDLDEPLPLSNANSFNNPFDGD